MGKAATLWKIPCSKMNKSPGFLCNMIAVEYGMTEVPNKSVISSKYSCQATSEYLLYEQQESKKQPNIMGYIKNEVEMLNYYIKREYDAIIRISDNHPLGVLSFAVASPQEGYGNNKKDSVGAQSHIKT